MDAFISWLFSDGGAGWIFGVITIIVFIVSRKRDLRATRIVVKEIRRIEPISVRSSIKDKIKISFDGREIGELGQIDLDIYNEGKDTISNASVVIEVPAELEILDGQFSDNNRVNSDCRKLRGFRHAPAASLLAAGYARRYGADNQS